jgi:hypothetical protein
MTSTDALNTYSQCFSNCAGKASCYTDCNTKYQNNLAGASLMTSTDALNTYSQCFSNCAGKASCYTDCNT